MRFILFLLVALALTLLWQSTILAVPVATTSAVAAAYGDTGDKGAPAAAYRAPGSE